MPQTPRDASATGDKIVRLPAQAIAEQAVAKPRGLGRLHGVATAGMAICALLGILSMLGFVTVRWPGNSSRYVVGLLVTAIVGFLVCCSIAVFSAARDTYPRHGAPVRDEEE